MTTKICSSCKEKKNVDEFWLLRGKPRSQCIKCLAGKAKIWRDNNKDKVYNSRKNWNINNPDKHRNSQLKVKYGITLDLYNQLLNEQGSKCAICGNSEVVNKTKFLSVDHCHITGKIRGLLCFGCNNGLGCFKDNTEKLQRAIDYLNKFKI